MTKVETINNAQQSKSPYSVFGSISKGIIGGSVLGYAAKYKLPLIDAEKDAEYGMIINKIRKGTKELKGVPIEAVRNLEKRTPAQDVFLQVVDAAAENSKAGRKAVSMRNIIKNSGLDSDGVKELKNIIAQVNEKSANAYKNYVHYFEASIKRAKRPTVGFTLAGAVVGFFAGLAHKIITG